MSTTSYPPVILGAMVKTTQENPALKDEWTEEGHKERKWDIEGTIIEYSDSHGLCYKILHEDNTTGWYDRSEFEILH